MGLVEQLIFLHRCVARRDHQRPLERGDGDIEFAQPGESLAFVDHRGGIVGLGQNRAAKTGNCLVVTLKRQ